MKRFLLIIMSILITVASCTKRERGLTVLNSSWPDGTIVSVIDGNTVVCRGKLYGERLSLRLPLLKEYRLRAASHGFLTYLSEPYIMLSPTENELPTVTLPIPVSEKRHGLRGLAVFAPELTDSLTFAFIERNRNALTVFVVPDSMKINNNGILSVAHEHGIGVLVYMKDVPIEKNIIDVCESAGIDGIMIECGKWSTIKDKTISDYATLISTAHERGLKAVLSFVFDSAVASLCEDVRLNSLYRERTIEERADEVAIVFARSDDGTPATASIIEDTLLAVSQSAVPLSILSIVYDMSGIKTKPELDGTIKLVNMDRGELRRVIASYRSGRAIRLPDASLRLGDKGALYAYDDDETMARMTSSIRSSVYDELAGLYLRFTDNSIDPLTMDSDVFLSLAFGTTITNSIP